MEDFSLPISHLSCEIQNYIHNISEVYQVDPDMVTLVVYTATAVSAGKRVTTFDGTYTNRLALWGIVIGISGAGKTEFASKVLQPILQRNAKLVNEYENAINEWDGKGKEPVPRDFRLHSVTLEALAEKINLNPDGLLLFRGELSGWVGGFGKYNRDDTEYASWIEVWDGHTFPIHTKTGARKLVNAKDPVLSVFGGVQPHKMKVFAKTDIIGTGFLSRLLMVYPPLCYPSTPPSVGFDDKLINNWSKFIERTFQRNDQFVFSPQAMEIYNNFCYNYVRERVLEIGEETTEPYSVCMRDFYGKIKVYAEKWAGISMLLSDKIGYIDAEVMSKTIEAMKAFEYYAQKTYSFIFSHSMTSTNGELIRKIDQTFGIKNRSRFADCIGVSRSLVSDYLNGKKN